MQSITQGYAANRRFRCTLRPCSQKKTASFRRNPVMVENLGLWSCRFAVVRVIPVSGTIIPAVLVRLEPAPGAF